MSVYAHLPQFSFDLVFPLESQQDVVAVLAERVHAGYIEIVQAAREGELGDTEILNWGQLTQVKVTTTPHAGPKPVVEAMFGQDVEPSTDDEKPRKVLHYTLFEQ